MGNVWQSVSNLLTKSERRLAVTSTTKQIERRPVDININKKAILNLFNETHKNPPFSPKIWSGTFSEYSNTNVVAVLATPKSGSTYITNVIINHANIPFKRLCYAYSSNEHDLYLPALMTAKATGGVSQLHMRATPHNVQLMNSFDIKGIILVRNIFDAVVSFRRDIQKKLNANHLGLGVTGYSFVWLNKELNKLSEEELTDYCIDFYVPWYLNFILSWENYRNNKRYLFVRYEELMENKSSTVAKIMKHIGEKEFVNKKILERDYLKNSAHISGTRSAIGSGYDTLTEIQVEKIKKKFNYFDFQNLEEYLGFDSQI